MMAVESDSLDTVALRRRVADVNARTVAGCTALTFAAENGHVGLSAMLIEQGANVQERTRVGRDALMIASRYGIAQVVQQLLSKGADPKDSDHEGRSALMQAASYGHIEVVELLLRHGANIDARDLEGDTALIMPTRAERTRSRRCSPTAPTSMPAISLATRPCCGRLPAATAIRPVCCSNAAQSQMRKTKTAPPR